MKTVDELMALADAYNDAYAEPRLSDTRAALLSALQEFTAPQPAQPYNADPSCTTVELAEMILSDCGCSSNNTSLISRVANRIDTHLQSAQPVAQPLSDEQIEKILDANRMAWASNRPPVCEFSHAFARAIERAHGIGARLEGGV